MKFRYSARTHSINLASNSQSPVRSFKSDIHLGRANPTKSLATILHVATNTRDGISSPHGIWTTLQIEFERQGDEDCLKFIFELKWNQSGIDQGVRSKAQRTLSRQVQDTFFPNQTTAAAGASEGLLPRAFYEAAFIPRKEEYTDLLSLSIPHLTSKLYPFQRRALQWLLSREGVRWIDPGSDCSAGAGLESHPIQPTSDLPLSFTEAKDADSRTFYLSDLYHVVTRDVEPFHELETSIRGGVLAEEMGLGKTVETISMILLHQRPPQPALVFDNYTGSKVRPTGATLIVTPATLKNQWISEFDKHAPHLRVVEYRGIKAYKGREDELLTELAEHDVVVTTYNVLQSEIHFAETPPERSMRHERRHPRPKSPLMQLSWWRVCLDEAQLVESGVSAAAKVARLIPRVNAWGITGTPVKENIKDLWGLLVFLRYEPFASYPAVWDAVTSTHRALFKTIFHRISLRHTKRAVRSELALPPQKRYVITMPFTAVEEQHYQSQFQELTQSCGLDKRGAPLHDDWDPDDPAILELMKHALAQLRQTVLHPELGPGRLRAVAQKNRPLRTIEEVLEAMIEQSESAIRTDQRNYLVNKLKRGQLLENSPRVRESLQIWQEVLDEVKVSVAESREQLQAEVLHAKQAGIDELDDSQSKSSESFKNADEEQIRTRVGEARRKLRSALDMEHRAVFFIANAYYQMKSNEDMTKPDSDEFRRLEKLEVDGYESAKQIRKEILQEAYAKASSYMKRLAESADTQSFSEIPGFKPVEYRGLESRRISENLEALCYLLDNQAGLIDEFREQVIQLLLRPLVDEDEEVEATGEEYENSTKIQDSLMAYTHVLRATIADRQDALSGIVNNRIQHETKVAERLAKDGEGPDPEKMLELLQERKARKPTPQQGSFRGIILEMRELATQLRHEAANGSNRAQVELDIVQQQLKMTQDQVTDQNKAALALEKELELFTAAMNARVEYYKQLQVVSDTVAPFEVPEDQNISVKTLMAGLLAEEQAFQHKVASAESKHRYLLHLRDAGQNSQEPKFCVICQSSFTLGVLTICGHQFCKECMTLWFKAHHNCPICKRKLDLNMLHDITLKKPEFKLHTEHNAMPIPESSHKARNKRSGIYSEFSDEKLQAIKNIDIDGPSFATKVDTLIKHVLWLRGADPGAKSIIFSQFREFLDVVRRAFTHYRIGFTSFDAKDGISRFKEDPGAECFLMDARSHASGLDLVNANHVFLCEPLLNTALELQAIARVDRIGQEHETTVWLYLVQGTVEESIYNLSVQRRMEHMGRNSKGKSRESTPEISDLNLEAANSLELEQAALKKLMSKEKQLGEEIDKSDLWECLFGHLSDGRLGRQDSQAMDERFNNVAVRGFLAAEAADARREAREAGEPSGSALA
ncbi:E3 ubiquitin-protein ligase [Pseudomassariella vexata]|uniref:E3 ubiquitin-protein ligase n=1 Tax=Pseudomassariella vexata TaxID=1141098 RepID=A0A1Y2EKC7_9PEZI|nr:E3 ubiquitin-protein ligase [Pseudomassariella vexata]ORY71999.1 E3 ubiquitin-protein ligase [Pseudomassariella vexata]